MRRSVRTVVGDMTTTADGQRTGASGSASSEPPVHYVMQPADWLRLALPGVIWGSSFYFIAEGLDSFEPALITPLRVLFGLLTLLAFPASRAPIEPADRWRIALLGVVWLAVPLTLFPFAEERVSSSVTGMLNGATPLFVATVATMIARRPPPGRQLVGLLVGFAGVVVIALPSLDSGSSSALGVGMIFAALACYGVSLNMARPLLLRYGSLPVLCRAQAVALVLTAPFGIAAVPRSSFAWTSALAVLALGVLGTGAAYVLAAANVGRLGSTRASVSTYLIPVVALALGVVIRDEEVAALAIIGSLVALSGAYLTNRSPRGPGVRSVTSVA
jgi:drug/metabolite transporter (DMT)-like permease